MSTPEEEAAAQALENVGVNVSRVSLADTSRYERRVRNLWSAEPQRGEYREDDAAARGKLAEGAHQFGLDFWATTQETELRMPETQVIFVAEWFNILGITIVALPTAALRDEFVSLNPGAAAVPDDAFWPE